MFRRSPLEARVLILAPIGRDSVLLAQTLAQEDIAGVIAPDALSLLEMLGEGAAVAVIAEEALTSVAMQKLAVWLASQPPWSDLPFIVLTSTGRTTRQSHQRAMDLSTLGNFTLIERPVRPETIQSSVRAAFRARIRQYEIRSRQEALLRANADLEQFAHSASHDLREPLRSIGLYTDLLSRDYGALLDDRGRQFLTSLRSSATRMDNLLSDLRDYAHVSSISEIPMEPISAMGPLEIALANLDGAIRESDAQITVAEIPSVRMHESHIAQIFQNLIGNAIKYRKTNEQPRISIAACKSEDRWAFSVTDNGIGVPAEYRENIFGLFKRLHNTDEYAGTGMGLAICQRIVERYGGRIWVESQSGDGARFVFTAPA
jgi:signal transduction histidine kinase